MVSTIPLDADKDDDEEPKTNERPDDVGRAPGFGGPPPLESKQIANHRRHQNHGAGEIHLQQLLGEWGLLGTCRLGSSKECEDDAGGDTSDGKIDVEAIRV